MKLEETKKLINNVIENEFNHVQDQELKGMDELEEYNKLVNKNNDRYELLLKSLPDELQKVLNDYYDICTDRMQMEARHYFKKGVDAGASNLNFIRDITGGMKFY